MPARKVKTKDLNPVRIPTLIHAAVDRFTNTLKMRIIKAAARQADADGPDESGKIIVTVEDVLRSAKAILPNVESEFQRFFTEVKASHARDAA